MSNQPATKTQSATMPVKINIVGDETLFDRAKELYQAISRRAYELFESRGREVGQDLEDWLHAERELLLPVPIEVAEYDNHVTVRAEVPGFNEHEIQVSLEPRRLVITGKME